MSDFRYDCIIREVLDADTAVLDIDLGFRVWWRQAHIRLVGINAPEKDTEAGRRARTFLMSVAPVDTTGFVLESFKDRPDKYGGRWLGKLFTPDGACINDLLVEKGFAKKWDGKGKKPV
jgi:endonuclease YncB( thermonuclease family)